MGTIADHLLKLRKEVPPGVKIVAVSKHHSVDEIMEAYAIGQRVFGENRAQELTSKAPKLPNDIEWHFIGHLQTNKVKQIIPFVSWIHSIDSYKLLREVDQAAKNADRKVKVLLQFHIAAEESKYGLNKEEATEMMDKLQLKPLEYVQPVGVMGMATFTNHQPQIAAEFEKLNHWYQWLKETWFPNNPDFSQKSMGMSDDYMIAVAAGSTIIRVGSRIFG